MPSHTKEDQFAVAAAAVINGNAELLVQLLADDPALITARSDKAHQATLLHYIAANGVEDEMQKTPSNAPSIAKILIEHGAELDALARCYGGDIAQTPLSLLVSSYHPSAAGLQGELVDILVSAGANVNGLDGAGGPIATAVCFGYKGAVDALVKNGARVQCIQVAAAIGDMSVLQDYFDTGHNLIQGAGVEGGGVIPSIQDNKTALSAALFYACQFGLVPIAEFLMERGAGLDWQGPEGFTALHGAAFRGDIPLINFLLKHNAPLEKTNQYGGTPLDTLCWSAVNAPNSNIHYPAIVELLLGAGACANVVGPFPTGRDDLDKILHSYRRSD